MGAIAQAQEVLDRGFYGVPKSRRVDAQSAHLIVQVGNALSDENRTRLDAMPIHKAALLCWKLTEKVGAA